MLELAPFKVAFVCFLTEFGQEVSKCTEMRRLLRCASPVQCCCRKSYNTTGGLVMNTELAYLQSEGKPEADFVRAVLSPLYRYEKLYAQEVECLGACEIAPMLQVNDDEYVGCLTKPKVDELIQKSQ